MDLAQKRTKGQLGELVPAELAEAWVRVSSAPAFVLLSLTSLQGFKIDAHEPSNGAAPAGWK
eukprot:scaffold51714_cov22-Prasinocladus_malaysianus.AAC.2